MKMPFRNYIGAPLWVDYAVQLGSWLDYRLARLGTVLTSWRWDLLERHCRCGKCLQRAAVNKLNNLVDTR